MANQGNNAVAALVRGAHTFLTAIQAPFNAVVTKNLIDLTTFLDKNTQENFPDGSIFERSFKGPAVSFVQKSGPNLIAFLASKVEGAYSAALTWLDARAKAGGF